MRKVCDKLPDVQKLTGAAVANVKRVGDYKGPADFGTKVHKEIADAIRKENDPNFKAEKSVIKTLLETGRKTSNSGNAQEVDPKMEADYGELGRSALMPTRMSRKNRRCAFTIPRPDGAA